MADNIAHFFADACTRAPANTLVRTAAGATLSYGEALCRANVRGEELRELGIHGNDPVIAYMDDTAALLDLYLAAAFYGFVPVPLSPGFSTSYLQALAERLDTPYVYTTPALVTAVNATGLRAMSYGPRLDDATVWLRDHPTGEVAHALEVMQRRAKRIFSSQLFMLQPTSGSTGEPKLVARSHVGFVRYANHVGNELLGLPGSGSPEKVLMAPALTHAFGLHILTTALRLGAELLIPSAIDTAVPVKELEQLSPTILPVTPRVLLALRRQHQQAHGSEAPFLGPPLRFLVIAGGRSDAEILRSVHENGTNVIEFYGSSEASLIAFTRLGDWRPGCAGRLAPDVAARLAEDGELLTRTPGQMLGYVDDAELTAAAYTEDGFYRTGDFADLTSEGYVRILGRKKDLFNAPDGSNIYPERIEQLVERLPGVRQVILVGDARPYICAFIAIEAPPAMGDATGVLSPQAFAEEYRRVLALVAEANTKLEAVERVRYVALHGGALPANVYATVGAGKVRRDRKMMMQRFAETIALLYTAPPSEMRVGAQSAAPA